MLAWHVPYLGWTRLPNDLSEFEIAHFPFESHESRCRMSDGGRPPEVSVQTPASNRQVLLCAAAAGDPAAGRGSEILRRVLNDPGHRRKGFFSSNQSVAI
jgi:hypothetical protein